MLELGPQEEEFHFKIGQSIDPNKIDYVFTYGPLGKKIAEGAETVLPQARILSFSDKQTLIDELKKHTDDRTLLLVKASRGMRLEEVVTSLQKNKCRIQKSLLEIILNTPSKNLEKEGVFNRE